MTTLVQPDCVNLWKCRKSRHGSLQADGKVFQWLFDARYGRHCLDLMSNVDFSRPTGVFKLSHMGLLKSLAERLHAMYVECLPRLDKVRILMMLGDGWIIVYDHETGGTRSEPRACFRSLAT
ncbi:hypothetical protein GOP47_0015992 [Adiantum capillus-veneris]|uniref:Uncharacterized protein n=1 Tax=Adiantum capillus-veneris TaxID=13818 RepID=A0A9D4ULL6_ADICA|nr:hypothetical protein GOP47_0015992 [Adiantum capillus-veneris]